LPRQALAPGPPATPTVPRPLIAPERGISPALGLGVDRTLGSFSPFQGRIYIAYTTGGQNIAVNASDNGGRSWFTVNTRVNDDNSNDGFSEGSRQQVMPSVSVDPSTGTLVATWYDARYDAALSRVSTFIASSLDGGETWSPQTFLNPVHDAVDAIIGENVVIEPIPTNQSAGNAGRDAVYNLGDRQARVVNGTVVAA
jgi:hypothetical protein